MFNRYCGPAPVTRIRIRFEPLRNLSMDMCAVATHQCDGRGTAMRAASRRTGPWETVPCSLDFDSRICGSAGSCCGGAAAGFGTDARDGGGEGLRGRQRVSSGSGWAGGQPGCYPGSRAEDGGDGQECTGTGTGTWRAQLGPTWGAFATIRTDVSAGPQRSRSSEALQKREGGGAVRSNHRAARR